MSLGKEIQRKKIGTPLTAASLFRNVSYFYAWNLPFLKFPCKTQDRREKIV